MRVIYTEDESKSEFYTNILIKRQLQAYSEFKEKFDKRYDELSEWNEIVDKKLLREFK